MYVGLLSRLEFGWVVFRGSATDEELLEFGGCVEELLHYRESHVMGLWTAWDTPIAKG